MPEPITLPLSVEYRPTTLRTLEAAAHSATPDVLHPDDLLFGIVDLPAGGYFRAETFIAAATYDGVPLTEDTLAVLLPELSRVFVETCRRYARIAGEDVLRYLTPVPVDAAAAHFPLACVASRYGPEVFHRLRDMRLDEALSYMALTPCPEAPPERPQYLAAMPLGEAVLYRKLRTLDARLIAAEAARRARLN